MYPYIGKCKRALRGKLPTPSYALQHLELHWIQLPIVLLLRHQNPTYNESSGCIISRFLFIFLKNACLSACALQHCEVNHVDLPSTLHQKLKIQCKQMSLDVIYLFLRFFVDCDVSDFSKRSSRLQWRPGDRAGLSTQVIPGRSQAVL